MSDDSQRPIIVKRVKKGGHGHHGGAWKIAFADFMTAMMAFFLLMWLLGSTSKGDLQGIAAYFNSPLKVAMNGGDGSDVYLFGRGDGQDSLTNYDKSAGRYDVVQLKSGITVDDVQLSRSSDHLILSILNDVSNHGRTNKTCSTCYYNLHKYPKF